MSDRSWPVSEEHLAARLIDGGMLADDAERLAEGAWGYGMQPMLDCLRSALSASRYLAMRCPDEVVAIERALSMMPEVDVRPESSPEPSFRVDELVAVRRAAVALFEKRFVKPHETATILCEQWADLGAALFGEDDARVLALRPKPKFRVGDWVVDPDGVTCIVTGNYQRSPDEPWLQRVLEGGFGGMSAWPVSRLRLATAEEIAAARGEA